MYKKRTKTPPTKTIKNTYAYHTTFKVPTTSKETKTAIANKCKPKIRGNLTISLITPTLKATPQTQSKTILFFCFQNKTTFQPLALTPAQSVIRAHHKPSSGPI
jgi:hypothetical protein